MNNPQPPPSDLPPTRQMARAVAAAIYAADAQRPSVARGMVDGLFRGLRSAGLNRAHTTELLAFYISDLPLASVPEFLHSAIDTTIAYNAAAGRWYPPCVLLSDLRPVHQAYYFHPYP